MKFFYSLFIFVSYSISHSQNLIDLPKISPASPEATSLGKYGEVPVNLSVGMVSFPVPICTIEESGFQLPVFLNYQHNGLVVDQIPGHIGMGWNLSAGGMITRQVRGRPDDYPEGYIGANMTGKNLIIPYIKNQLTAENRDLVHMLATDGALDTQPDKFIASVGDMSVSFYFDENRTPVIKPYKPYVIEVVNDDFSFNQGIKITDDKGIQYFFQDIERTKQIPYGGQVQSMFLNYYPTGWKLSKIITLNNDIIELFYDDTVHYQSLVSQTFGEKLSGSCGDTFNSVESRFQIESKLIKNIKFSAGEIEFDNTIVTLSGGLGGMNKYLSYLNKIEIKDFNGNITNSFNLNYDNINKTRKVLTEVKIKNDNSNKYSFEYYGVVPDDISYEQQDFWGFYNNNTTGYLMNNFNAHNIYGGRAPDFNRSVLGALKKITYPTKGSSTIVYEPNTYNPEHTDPVPYGCQTAKFNNLNSGLTTLNYIEQNGGVNVKEDSFEFVIHEGFEYAEVQLIAEKISQNGCGGLGNGHGAYGRVEVILQRVDGVRYGCADIDCYGGNTPSGGCEGAMVQFGGPLHCLAGSDSFNRRLKLTSGLYRVDLKVNSYGLSFGVGDILRASARIKTFNGVDESADSVETGGIRISKLINCPGNAASECIEKEFIYETNTGVSQGFLYRRRNILSHDFQYSVNGGNGTCSSTYKIHSSSSNVPLGFYMGSHVYYHTVVEKIKDYNGVNLGYTEKNYKTSGPQPSVDFPYISVDDKSFMDGNISSEKTFGTTSATPVLQVDYEYDFGVDNLEGIDQEVWSLSIGVESQTINNGGQVSQDFKVYANNVTVFSNKHDRAWLSKVKTKELLEGLVVETIKDYQYANPQGHVKKEVLVNSKNEVLTTDYFYPYNTPNAINNLLVSKNRLITLIETQVNKDGALLSGQKTLYRDWGNNIITPESIESSKDTISLEERIRYHKYDLSNGNPLEVSKADAPHIVYIWGYNDQYLIAKIENATYGDIPSSIYDAIVSASNADSNRATEDDLRSELEKLRNSSFCPDLAEAMVTTYTYDPLIGVTSMTDPKGYTIFYEYDSFNRLEYVKDHEDNILSENEYHYRGQM